MSVEAETLISEPRIESRGLPCRTDARGDAETAGGSFLEDRGTDSVGGTVAHLLASQGDLPAWADERLVELIGSTHDARSAVRTASVLSNHGALPSVVVQHLAVLIATSDDTLKALDAARMLASQQRLPDVVAARLRELALQGRRTAYAAIWCP